MLHTGRHSDAANERDFGQERTDFTGQREISIFNIKRLILHYGYLLQKNKKCVKRIYAKSHFGPSGVSDTTIPSSLSMSRIASAFL